MIKLNWNEKLTYHLSKRKQNKNAFVKQLQIL